MTPRRQRPGAILAGSVVAGIAVFASWLPVFGQEDSGGSTVTLGISTSLETSDNADLSLVSPGNTTQLNTTFTLGFESVTRSQALRFSVSDTLRNGDGPGSDSGLRGPDLFLSYGNQAANARIDLSAQLTTRDVDGDPDEEELDDPDALLVSDGTLSVLTLTAGLETGLEAPVGAFLSFSQTSRDYSADAQVRLDDNRRFGGSVGLILRPNDVTEARLSFGFDEFEEDDFAGTKRSTRSYNIDASRRLDPVTTIRAGVGWTEITEDFDDPTLESPDETGLTSVLGFERDLAAGSFSAELSRSVASNGGRTDLAATRIFALPSGSVELTLGAAKPAETGVQAVGRVAFSRATNDQRLGLSLSSQVSVNNDSEVQRDTIADVSYDYRLNARGSLGLDLDYVQTSGLDGVGIIDRTRITATANFRRELTADWTLSTGLRHRVSREEGLPDASSNTFFLTLGRDYSWRW
ncbi:MAG: hypothetical protein AAFP13_09445 [Pseudomonadota bacterium]